MTLQFAKLAGAETVAVDTSEAKLKLAQDIGADHALTAMELDEFIVKTGRPDVVMVHAPSQKAVEQALRIVKRGGTVLMGVCGDAPVQFPEEYTIMGSVIGTRQEMNEVLRLASMGKVRVDWNCYRLSEAEDVLIRLKQGKIVGRAILGSLIYGFYVNIHFLQTVYFFDEVVVSGHFPLQFYKSNPSIFGE